ncbi:type II toxin-antitoxin system ParD family antitoxin [Phenylobacterium sp.]|uniref:type II toxin-antitoxin system ParD family antitoxin n=1 Tax=Phenylobacterium sp. TaxID=1871053 RepID=UPI0025FAD732|nr:type II toxin-antitoxin system ParD family antitoxin [Phenylobacterium sp.]
MAVTLASGQKAFVEERVRGGRFASASEVVREGLRALEREKAHLDAWIREKIRESLNDPGADIPAEDVFAELRARNASWPRDHAGER